MAADSDGAGAPWTQVPRESPFRPSPALSSPPWLKLMPLVGSPQAVHPCLCGLGLGPGSHPCFRGALPVLTMPTWIRCFLFPSTPHSHAPSPLGVGVGSHRMGDVREQKVTYYADTQLKIEPWTPPPL